MSDTVIKVENLSKQYRLGTVGTGSFAHDLNRGWHKIRGKEDPYLRIGEVNDRAVRGESEYVWALRNINFDVKQGDIVGIIGSNGAGKSTLLKILSKTTTPTTGCIKLKGRVASLLEVGTGFHPELSGRENIFLNGAILGMSRNEIKSKFDEIVDFSGVDRYIDTPVKRYSSGMYVRLAFGVAAHLEPEILIVDEVLAVGDAEFQRKALGKMKDVSANNGRTVIFVSHNMVALEKLCTVALFMEYGSIKNHGDVSEMIKDYIRSTSILNTTVGIRGSNSAVIYNDKIAISYLGIENAAAPDKNDVIDVTSEIDVVIQFCNYTKARNISVGFDLKTTRGDTVFGTGTRVVCETKKYTTLSCRIPGNFLNNETYTIFVYFHNEDMVQLYSVNDKIVFEIKDIKRENGYLGKINGFIRPTLSWLQVD